MSLSSIKFKAMTRQMGEPKALLVQFPFNPNKPDKLYIAKGRNSGFFLVYDGANSGVTYASPLFKKFHDIVNHWNDNSDRKCEFTFLYEGDKIQIDMEF